MVKGLFKASFEESQRIQEKYEPYIKNLHEKMGFFNISFIGFLSIFFIGGMLYVLGVAVPIGFSESEKNSFYYVRGENMVSAGRIGHPLVIISEITLIVWISMFLILICLRLSPIWNVRTLSFFGGIGLFQMSMLLFLSFFPMLVGLSIVGSGIPGFVFQLVIVLLFFIRSMKSMPIDLSRTLYGGKTKNLPKPKNTKLFFLVFVILIVNSLFPKIGFVTKVFDIFGIIYGWLFILFGVGTIAVIRYATFKNFLCAYYFAKYSDQYRELWELTDEQWYGKGKAKRMARKKARKNKKFKMK